jgi:hypothetical protein
MRIINYSTQHASLTAKKSTRFILGPDACFSQALAYRFAAWIKR